MKHIYSLFMLFACITSVAQSKIDLQGQIMLREYANSALSPATAMGDKSPMSITLPSANATAAPVVTAIVELADGASADDLRDAGYDVTAELITMALVRMPLDKAEDMAKLDAVKKISFGGRKQLFLDKARAASQVDAVHSGVTYNGESHSYTGKGVFTGIYDVGVAPNHINFLSADGKTRVKQIYYYPNDSTRYTLTQQGIEQWTCEDSTETHGTHTLGIMAGGYKGNLSVAVEGLSAGTATTATKANPYYGLATESDILVSCGELYDATTIDGMIMMSQYAQENGQPCVINYSAGSPTGPHDGTDYFARALAQISQQYGSIICLAAGNSGADKMSVEKTFTSATDALKTCVTPLSGYSGAYAIVDFWADDNQPFSIKFSSLKPKFFIGSDTNTTLFTVNAADQEFNVVSTSNSALKSAFKEAQIIAMSEVNETNNRFHVMALVYYARSTTYKSFIHIEITGNSGQHIFGTLSNLGELTAQSSISGSVDGNAENSISDACTNPQLISVGSYNTRQYYGRMDGKVYGQNSGYTDGGISSFSSYGSSFDGTQYPIVTAPGNIIISSFNPYYVEQSTDEPATTMSGTVTSSGKEYHWGSMSGTSMACPYVAGTIALWLEADPTLTATDIIDIISKTATQDDNVKADAKKAGYGKINAEDGLKEVLRRLDVQGVTDPAADPEKSLIVQQSGNVIDIFLAGARRLTATLHDIQGRVIATQQSDDCELSLNSGAVSGIYLLTVSSDRGTFTRKIAIR